MHHNNYRSFKALGIMLCYPSDEWVYDIYNLYQVIEDEKLLRVQDLQLIKDFVLELQSKDLLEAQEDYVENFDRVRSLSLHLFEHIHGESRDRGQAMVDLSEIYKEKGFSLDKSELPDYLPVFLEHLSYLPKDEAIEMLKEPIKILKALGKRLAERGSCYSIIFDSLLKIAGEEPEKVEKRRAVKISHEQLDKEWEEKPIIFLGAEAPNSKAGKCGGSCHCDATSKLN